MKTKELAEKIEKQEEEINKLKKKSRLQKWINLFLIFKD